MNSVRSKVLTILYILAAVMLGIALVIALGIGFGTGIRGMYSTALPEITGHLVRHPRVTLMAVLALLFVGLMAAGAWITNAGRKECRITATALTAFLIAVQLWIVFGLNIIQNTDSFEVQDQAMAIAKGLMQSVDYEKSDYFLKYGNNDLYLILCIGMYRLCDALHIANWSKFFVLFNMLCIDAGIFMSCHALAVLRGCRTALKGLLLHTLNPLNYLFLHWTYTCTYSVALMMLGFCLFLYVRRHEGRTIRKAVCVILIGLTAVIGYYFRPTAVFPIIAILLCVVLWHLPLHRRPSRTHNSSSRMYDRSSQRHGRPSRMHECPLRMYDRSSQKHDRSSRTHQPSRIHQPSQMNRASRPSRKYRPSRENILYTVLVLVLTVVLMLTMAGAIQKDADRYDTDHSYDFPMTHWLMVGNTGTGRLTSGDLEYTEQFHSTEEMKQGNMEAARIEFRERGFGGNVLFYMGKIGLSWSDGTGEYYQRTTQSENSQIVLYQVITGDKRGLVMIYAQAYRIILLLLTVLGILRAVKRGPKDIFFAVYVITLLGGLVFYLFWEGKPVYSLPFMPFLIMIGCEAWNPLSRMYETTRKHSLAIRRTESIVITGIIGLVIVVFASDSRAILRKQTYSLWSIVCSNPSIKELVSMDQGDLMVQEFSPAYPFNRIRLSVVDNVKNKEDKDAGNVQKNKTDKNHDENSQVSNGNADGNGQQEGVYQITLRQGSRDLERFEVSASDIQNGKIVLAFDEIIPQEKGELYQIAIRNLSDADDTISWDVRKCYIASQYKGERYLNTEPQIGDTLMDVYDEYQDG